MDQGDHLYGGEGAPPSYSSGRVRRIVLWCVALLAVSAIAGWLIQFGSDTGVGDVERAQNKVKVGMTKDEVRAALGNPHKDRGNEWDYWNSSVYVGSILRIHFEDDDRVGSSEWWLD